MTDRIPWRYLIVLIVVNMALLLPPGNPLRSGGGLLLIGLMPGLLWARWLITANTLLLRWTMAATLSYSLTILVTLGLHYLPGPILRWQLLLVLNGLGLLPVLLLIAITKVENQVSAGQPESPPLAGGGLEAVERLISTDLGPNQGKLSPLNPPAGGTFKESTPKSPAGGTSKQPDPISRERGAEAWPERSRRGDGAFSTETNKSKKPGLPLFLSLVLATGILLRATSLGYSEFQGDEALAMISAAEALEGHEDALFLRSKGPGEVLLPMALWRLTGVINEATARLPFTIASLWAIITLYLIGQRLTGSTRLGGLAALFFMLNGFAVAFGRIVQYQALVIWLSSLAFLLMIYWRDSRQDRYAILAGLSLGAGLLAHYDAILVLPAIAWFFLPDFKQTSFGQWLGRLWHQSLQSGLLFVAGHFTCRSASTRRPIAPGTTSGGGLAASYAITCRIFSISTAFTVRFTLSRSPRRWCLDFCYGCRPNRAEAVGGYPWPWGWPCWP